MNSHLQSLNSVRNHQPILPKVCQRGRLQDAGVADAWQLCSTGTQRDAPPREISGCGMMERSAAGRQVCTQSGSTMETAGEQRRHREGRSGQPCQDLRGMSEILLCAWCAHLPELQPPPRSAEMGLPRDCSRLWALLPHL